MSIKRTFIFTAFLTVFSILPQFNVYAAVRTIKTVTMTGDYKAVKFSEAGNHVGFVEKRGSQYRAVIDGKPEKLYDDVTVVEFSPNGKHYFYGAEINNKWFLFRDGKKITELGSLTSVNQGTGMSIIGYGRSVTIWSSLLAIFSPKANNYFIVAYPGDSGKIFKDGKWLETKFSSFWRRGMVISPDGKHYAYTVEPEHERSGFLYIDGVKEKQGGAVDDLFYVQPNNQLAVMSDSILTVMDSKGALISMVKNVASKVAQSPDGKHLALLQTMPNKKHSVIVDGKKELEYDNVVWGSDGGGWYSSPNSFVWSNDYSSHAYLVRNADKSMAVSLNGKTLKHFPEIVESSLVISSNGEHVVYIVKKDKQKSIVLDDKVIATDGEVKDVILKGKKSNLVYIASKGDKWIVSGLGDKTEYEDIDWFHYSASKNHVAYVAKTGKDKWIVVVDGKALPGKYDSILQFPQVKISDAGVVSFVVKEKGELKWMESKVK